MSMLKNKALSIISMKENRYLCAVKHIEICVSKVVIANNFIVTVLRVTYKFCCVVCTGYE